MLSRGICKCFYVVQLSALIRVDTNSAEVVACELACRAIAGCNGHVKPIFWLCGSYFGRAGNGTCWQHTLVECSRWQEGTAQQCLMLLPAACCKSNATGGLQKVFVAMLQVLQGLETYITTEKFLHTLEAASAEWIDLSDHQQHPHKGWSPPSSSSELELLQVRC